MTTPKNISAQSIVTYVLFALMGAWCTSLQSTVRDMIALKPQYAQTQKDIHKLEEWQDNWERGGALPADIAQDKDIQYLKEYVEDLKTRINKVENLIINYKK